MTFAAPLSHRTLIRIGGADRYAFLQGLLSNDVMKASEDRAVYAALLSPQGKFLHDLFLLHVADAFWVDCEAGRAEDLLRRLNAYKLRSKVTFENLTDRSDVWAIWGGAHSAPQTFVDPRLPELGMRAFVEKNKIPVGPIISDFSVYDERRLHAGVADGSRDMEIEKSTLAEGNFDFLNGVDWKKGCYVGQELTARMHYRGLAKRRLFPVRVEGAPIAFGAQIEGDGEMRSSCHKHGLALLKTEDAQKAINEEKPLTYQNTKLWVGLPSWMKPGL